MNRRQLLLAGLAAAAPTAGARAAGRTQWKLYGSEGFDALCFLGPLSGKPFYADFYKAELAAFRPGFPAQAQAALDSLQAEADARGALLGPSLCTLFSGGPCETLADLIVSLDQAQRRLRPPYRASDYWDADDWQGFLASRDRLRVVFEGLKSADFPALRRRFLADRVETRQAALAPRLGALDVVGEQERLLGRRLDPTIDVVLLWFSKPHGIRVQGQRFLSHVDYPEAVVVRTAAHEILHPPFPMDGPAARAALEVLGRDPLLARIVAEHDPKFGYNSLDGLLNEDTVEALDQVVSERLGFDRPPAQRWAAADDGMHVLAAGLYGLLKADGYDRTGGDIARWTIEAARSGKLAPASLHAAAGRVLQLPPDRLWPRPKA